MREREEETGSRLNKEGLGGFKRDRIRKKKSKKSYKSRQIIINHLKIK